MWAAVVDLGIDGPQRVPGDSRKAPGTDTAPAWATREQDRDEAPHASWTWGTGVGRGWRGVGAV